MIKPNIMVVDDESILRMDLKEMLLENGYNVVAEANNGEKAVELAAKHKPDLIIMDVKMPKMNGIKAAKIVGNTFKIPVLLLTAYSQTEIINEAKEAGVLGFIVKPVTEKQLIPAVEVALSQVTRINQIKGEVTALEQKLEERKIVEKAKGIVMEHMSLNEDQAYKQMRSFCMKNRIVLKDLARTLIDKNSAEIMHV
ncbi:ANTAR domain-containing response regulator [Fictibacillus aquaticus]|jgi:response regulator NasT|uniref:Response regulator n=1 Tax=Fictibacillus aquaticus TaxID=2021314 RepID=A0A235F653_9BACL|nr:response regulator [Fictibacillus aquaticus]OYD56417.1 response regulator [Fictibacillus aquaticus]